MKLPKTIKIGRTTYDVSSPLQMSWTASKGDILYGMQWIRVALQCNVTKRRFTEKERAETFWHEVTHGILFDMDHPLFEDEKFVRAFSKRLNDAIHSAKF